jgi:hypothetical protein
VFAKGASVNGAQSGGSVITDKPKLGRAAEAMASASSKPIGQDRLEVWRDGSAICIIAVGSHGDPLDLGEHEVEDLIAKLQSLLEVDR